MTEFVHKASNTALSVRVWGETQDFAEAVRLKQLDLVKSGLGTERDPATVAWNLSLLPFCRKVEVTTKTTPVKTFVRRAVQ